MLPRSIRAVAGLAVAFAATRPAVTRADQLDEATFIQRVLDRSPRRVALDERNAAARAQVGVASVLPNPTLSYEREDVGALGATDFFRLGWTIDISGRRGAAIGAASAGAEAERFDVERERWLLEVEARLAYLDATYAREQLARLDAARVPLAELVDALRSRAKQGDASTYDADRATLELEILDDERATVHRSLEIARLRLGALIGEPGTAYDASGALQLPTTPAAVTPRRPDIDAARARVTQADRELAGARRTWIPRFELMGGMMSQTSTSGQGLGYVLGIGGDLPVFNAGGAAASRARADAKRWRSEAAARANDSRAEIEQARHDLALRIAQAEKYIAGPAARAVDLQRRAGVAYREGDRPILELLDVQRNARSAALRALELIYEARRSALALNRAIGRNP